MATRQLDFTGFVSANDPRTFPTNAIRNLQAESGNSNAVVEQSGSQSADVGNSILDVLRQYQKFGRQTELKGQQEQINRTFQTPSDLIGASPSQQSSVRDASVQAVQPTIGSARSLVQEASDLLKDYQLKQESTQKSAQDIIDTATATGSAGLEELMRVQPDLFKQAGTNIKAYEAVLKGLKAKEIRTKSEGTATERQDTLRKAAAQKAQTALMASRGTDGFVDPQLYMKLRTDYATAIGDVKDFDATFLLLLSSAQRIKLGLEKRAI